MQNKLTEQYVIQFSNDIQFLKSFMKLRALIKATILQMNAHKLYYQIIDTYLVQNVSVKSKIL